MTALTRPIRRLLGRQTDVVSADPVTSIAPDVETPRAANEPTVAVDIPESDPLLAYLPRVNCARPASPWSSRSSRKAN
jgi:hypothetical protein